MINNIMDTSQKFNRSICTQYDHIVKKITSQSETTDQLVRQQDYVERLRLGELFELNVSGAGERVMIIICILYQQLYSV